MDHQLHYEFDPFPDDAENNTKHNYQVFSFFRQNPDQPEAYRAEIYTGHTLLVRPVLGACNVSKILIQVPIELHKNTVNMLTFVADARLRNPVYGCFGAFVLLQRKMTELQHDLAIARSHSSIRCCPELHAFQLQSSKLQSGVTRA
ncbi:LOB domain-containing protein 21 isoform X1 [Tripterygium wilfordii]|uniref:LOB domain-containing protein 21 isoform X1 n=1 Tax=Tripterygium wilfordii TaxID=458696 RepID=A0A7J7CR12_TRIWF|nr:LOB domain-containing protein 21 isoform X1 [Tripterygium wilfordii]